MAAPIVSFNDHKLETEFHDDYVVHKTSKWELSTREWAYETWRKEKKIGEGAFGSVWLQKKQGDQVELRAVKLLPRESFSKNGISQELLALVKLKDYNHLFVQFFGWYENADQVFLAMEYIEYGDLAQYMLQNPQRTTEVAKEITKQILEGLEVIHRKMICHRDLKPQNILVASLDPIWVKITDFGISKQTKNTVARTLCGTHGYMAPEILGALPRRLIPREPILHSLDMWALGSVLYELLTSKKPFTCTPDEDSYTGIEALEEPMVDMTLLFEYCSGISEFPDEDLQQSLMSEDSIAFVRSLLSPDPRGRPTATRALQNPWLVGYTSDWFEGLKKEFSDVGASLSLYISHKENDTMSRQARKADILRFLPAPKIEKVPFLLLEAAARGYHSTISKLLQSPSRKPISLSTWERLFQTVTETDTITLLLHYQAEISACINDKSILEWAVRAGYLGTVTQLLENTSNSVTNTDYKRYFIIAAELGNSDMIKLFLGNRAVTGLITPEWQAALKVAFEGGYTDIVKLLLDNKVSVNAGIHRLLKVAFDGGYTEIFKLLLDIKANVNPATQMLLQVAVEGGHTDIFKAVLDNKAYLKPERQGLLQAVAKGGYTHAFRLLLNCTAPLNPGTQRLLQTAFDGGYIDNIKLVLDYKATVNKGTLISLHAAAKGGYIDIVKLLLDHKATVNAGTQTSLQAAAKGGYIDIVKLLLDHKATVNAGIQTSLHPAAKGGYTDIFKLLLDHKATVNVGTQTLLQAAAKGGYTDIVKLLLDQNATVNVGTQTLLQAAAKGGYIDIVKLLLDYKAEVDAGTKSLLQIAKDMYTDVVKLLENKTDISIAGTLAVLQVAADGGYLDITKLLLDNNTNVNAAGTRTALQAAAANGHIDTVKLLLENKADVNGAAEYSSCGRTALQAASGSGYIDIAGLLLSSGADVNAPAALFVGGRLTSKRSNGYNDNKYGFEKDFRDSNLWGRLDKDITKEEEGGRTALEAAAEGGHTDIVKLLLDNKAELYPVVLNDYPYRRFFPQGALVLAARGGHIEVIRLLLKAGMCVHYTSAIYFKGYPSMAVHVSPSYTVSLTPLGEATKGGHLDVAKMLLGSGARTGIDVLGYDSQKHALVEAVQHGRREMVELFLAIGPTHSRIHRFVEKGRLPRYFMKALQEARLTRNQALIKLLGDAEPNFKYL